MNLWNEGLQIIFSDKYLLLFGYLSIPRVSIWWLPHNIYTLSWIEFGVPGFLLLISLGVFFLYAEWKRHGELRSRLPDAVLWAGMAGLFLINGITSLYFHEAYVIINFICVAAIWVAQIREIDSSLASVNSGDPQTGIGSAFGKIIPNPEGNRSRASDPADDRLPKNQSTSRPS